jgi:hypothetical protein
MRRQIGSDWPRQCSHCWRNFIFIKRCRHPPRLLHEALFTALKTLFIAQRPQGLLHDTCYWFCEHGFVNRMWTSTVFQNFPFPDYKDDRIPNAAEFLHFRSTPGVATTALTKSKMRIPEICFHDKRKSPSLTCAHQSQMHTRAMINHSPITH